MQRCQPAPGRYSGCRANEAGVDVVDDESRADEPSLVQPAQEAEPARVGLRVDGHEAEHAAHAVGPDVDRGDDGRRPHAAFLSPLDVRGVEEGVQQLDSAQVAGRQLADFGDEQPVHGVAWSFESLSVPILRAICSIFLVETSFAHDPAMAAATARSPRE